MVKESHAKAKKIYGISMAVQPVIMILCAVFSIAGKILHIVPEDLFYLTYCAVVLLNLINIIMNAYKINPEMPFRFMEKKAFAVIILFVPYCV